MSYMLGCVQKTNINMKQLGTIDHEGYFVLFGSLIFDSGPKYVVMYRH